MIRMVITIENIKEAVESDSGHYADDQGQYASLVEANNILSDWLPLIKDNLPMLKELVMSMIRDRR